MLLGDTREYCKHVHKLYQEKVNIESSTTATLALIVHQVGNSLGNSKAPRKLTAKSFLPFVLEDTGVKALSTSHKQTMERLIKEQKLSIKLTSIVASAVR